MKENFAGKKEINKLNVGLDLSQIKNKSILVLFILLIIIFVGVRIWAEKEISNVPFPLFISASEHGVAVSWGQTIYLLDHEGRVTGKENYPKSIVLTQVKLIDDELWIADYESGSIYKLKNDKLTKIINAPNIILGTFKFIFNKDGDKIYITDSSNHKVHIFDKQGKFQKSFGREGKAPGELKFPNSIVLTKDGNFLIVNTNAHRLDIYSPEGEFIKTFATTKAIGKKFDPKQSGALRELLLNGEAALSRYEWPSILTQSGDKVVFLLAKNGFHKAKVIVYDQDGQFSGELAPPEPLTEPGDLASWGDKVVVTDNEARKIHLFNVNNMSYAGEFSKELEKSGIEAAQKAKEYRLISRLSLISLLLLAVPVFILLIRQRRKEAKDIDATDIKTLVPSDAIWAVDVDKNKMIISYIILIFIIIVLSILRISMPRHIIIIPLIFTVISMLGSFYAIKLITASGYNTVARRPLIEKMLKEVLFKVREILKPGETVVGCTALQLSSKKMMGRYKLFILTNRQFILYDFAGGGLSRLTPTDSSSYGYRNVKNVSVEIVNKPSRFMGKALTPNMYMLRLSIEDSARLKDLIFYLDQKQILDKIKTFLDENRLKGEFINSAALNKEETFKAIHPGLRGKAIPEKLIAPILSAIFPGLGQFYNRQILKGTCFSAVFLLFIFLLIEPLRTIIEKSAEYRQRDLLAVVFIIITVLFFYGTNIVDAYFNSKKKSL